MIRKSQSKEFGGKRKNPKDILETRSIGIFEQVPWDELKIETELISKLFWVYLKKLIKLNLLVFNLLIKKSYSK